MLRVSPRPLPPDPLWYKDAVVYQLHLKSFFDANNDGIGDFPGLLAKLDYIASLGVTAVWLLPFYPSPRRDDGYDISEYRNVHPDYGTMADVRRFIAAAHERGIRVITELVINHTSDQHPWFQRARRAKRGTVARNFYVWSDSDQKYAGTRIIFLDTEKSNWSWDAVAGQYYWHRFYAHQPDLNFDNPAVFRAVLGVMRFWLELGVDGLRLDAVPYLVEREGTNNENLAETHAVLKRIRAELDAAYPGRMLLAEANQWPEDTQQYFGEGDECHMAFHFPLMPRMYMAIAREDRFPITDIMQQTPEIPSNCQWAIFLRNHDELTLEMVTDAERDYLWQVYAADRRARINLGIRRRLAPLLERDRRRVELMNSLLLSMPGTPVIYYGDEIGMGDNIHLGDRDGVRTPMQWSPDRNGGFSRADPAQLVLPPIMDPLYGYEAVNVEAQSRDPHSLLNWMRRMLAVRREHRAFGRGTLRFLYPRNRKVLAYLREYEDETILCVANLSRASQAVELDLAHFAGRVPVEMTAGSAFPPIGQLTYLLTLPPYGFYWFILASEASMPAWHTPAPEMMPEYATLVSRSQLLDILSSSRARNTLETQSLPAYLPKRRWFAAKNEALVSTRVALAVPLPEAPDTLISEIEVRTGSGTDRYVLPLGVAWEEETSAALPHQLALARLRRANRVGLLTDAFSLESFVRGFIEALRAGQRLTSPEGDILFLPTDRLTEEALRGDEPVTWLAAEQSNSSLTLDNAAVVKLVRHVLPGVHPEAEMSRRLTELGFANTAPLFGEVVRIAPDGARATLALVQGYLRNQGDGWAWTLDYLRRATDDATVLASGDDEGGAEIFKAYRLVAAAIGLRLGEMHTLLATPTEDPDFAPETADAECVRSWAAAARRQLEQAVAATARAGLTLEADRAMADVLADRRRELMDLIERLAERGRGSTVCRIHGDFHLGQVLIAQSDAYIIDFEGEPARPLAERRAKASPLRDVAGLLRSLDYAAALATRSELGAERPGGEERKRELLLQFRREAEEAFLAGYRKGSAGVPHQWSDPGGEEALVDLFTIQKAAYEVCYEAANRPGWIGIPLRDLAELAADLTGASRMEHA